MRIAFFISLIVLSSFELFAQRETDFDEYYDPLHPNRFILVAPGLLGPNALPVQPVRNALIGTNFELEAKVASHFMSGDHAVDLEGHLLAPVVRKFMALETHWYVMEYFRTSTEVRDIRHLPTDDTGWKLRIGDLSFNFLLQFIEGHRFFPDIMGVMGFKTTLGDIVDGRYTNTPAHWFSLHLGRNLVNKEHFTFRLNTMIGLFIYQTINPEVSQDEGPMLGIESRLRYKDWWLRSSFSGYTGWEFLGHNDPIYFISRITKKQRRVDWFVEYQTGLRDYPYETFRAGLNFHLPSPLSLKIENWKEILKEE